MSSGEKRQARHDRLFAHIATYELTVRSVAKRLFCNDSETTTKNLFDPLLGGKLEGFDLSKGSKVKYYVLSTELADRYPTQVTRGRLSAMALHEAVAILAFCHPPKASPSAEAVPPPEVKRSRIRPGRLAKILGFIPNWQRVFVAETSPEKYAACVIVPGKGARPDSTINIIEKLGDSLLQHRSAHPALALGAFRFVVLVHSEPRKELFDEALKKIRKQNRILSVVRVDIVAVPDLARPEKATPEENAQ